MARGFQGRKGGGGKRSPGSTYSARTQSRPGLTVATQRGSVNFGKLSRKMGTSPKIRARTVGNKAWKRSTQMHRPRFAKPIVSSSGNGPTLNARRGL